MMQKRSKVLYMLRFLVVGVRGFEPRAPASRRQYSTRLSYTPTAVEAAYCTDRVNSGE